MPFISATDGSRLHYQIDGAVEAPVVLLANPLGTDLSFWDGLVRELERRFRILRYDPRGHGQSDAPHGDYLLEHLCRDALALLDGLDIERASFCGVSMGGAVGQWLAANAGERIDRLVLSNTAVDFGPAEGWNLRIGAARQWGMQALVPNILDVWFTPEFRSANNAEVERLANMLRATSVDGYAGCSAAVRDADLHGCLAHITVPTLIVGGTRDVATTPSQSAVLAGAIAHSKHVLLDCAHLAPIEQAQSFNKLILEFFN